ncbi:MAG TPA: hypothetical protein PLI34_20150, partial [Saprospiraceae bacterium]|nr:hypothetical protein [Saprospiraceae bacterium]
MRILTLGLTFSELPYIYTSIQPHIMIERIDIANVLFLDIETVSATASYEDLDENFQELWFHKTAGILRKPED